MGDKRMGMVGTGLIGVTTAGIERFAFLDVSDVIDAVKIAQMVVDEASADGESDDSQTGSHGFVQFDRIQRDFNLHGLRASVIWVDLGSAFVVGIGWDAVGLDDEVVTFRVVMIP